MGWQQALCLAHADTVSRHVSLLVDVIVTRLFVMAALMDLSSRQQPTTAALSVSLYLKRFAECWATLIYSSV
jgi:hypothetical protein